MDMHTWRGADLADDARPGEDDGRYDEPEYQISGAGRRAEDRALDPKSYRARHRSRRSPFSPLRPAPIAIGSLSTAAIAAFALAGPGILHSGKAASDQAHVDGMPQHVGPLTPGPVAPSTTAPTGHQASTPSDGGSTASSTLSSSASPRPTSSTPSTPAKQSATRPSGAASLAPTPPNTATGQADSPLDPGPASNPGASPAPPSSAFPPVAPPSTGGAGSPSAPPTTTPTTPPQPAFDAAAAQQTALNEITAARKAQGNRPLTVDGTLTKAAAQHTADMVVNNYFSHTGSNGSSPTVRAIGLGYWGLSKEILARGNPGDDVVAALLKDPQSSYALLSGANSTIGVSAQQDPTSGQVIWTVELGYW